MGSTFELRLVMASSSSSPGPEGKKNPDPVSLRYVTGMSNAIGGCHVETIRSIVAAFRVVVQSDLIRRLITD